MDGDLRKNGKGESEEEKIGLHVWGININNQYEYDYLLSIINLESFL